MFNEHDFGEQTSNMRIVEGLATVPKEYLFFRRPPERQTKIHRIPTLNTTDVDSLMQKKEAKKEPFSLTTVFEIAAEQQQQMAKQNRTISKREALEVALIQLATTQETPFNANPEERKAIAEQGVPDVIDHRALFSYVEKNADIPVQNPYNSSQTNPDYVRFQERIAAYKKYIPEQGHTSMPWAGALELLELAWNEHSKKPLRTAELQEREREKYKDTRIAGIKQLERHKAYNSSLAESPPHHQVTVIFRKAS